MALDSTVGGANSNSLLSRSRAIELIGDRIDGGLWLALSTSNQDASLITATRLVCSLRYIGSKTFSGQRLCFPRTGLTLDKESVDSTIIPYEIEIPTAELAFTLTQQDTTLESAVGTLGITKVKASSVEVQFKDKIEFSPIPLNVLNLIPIEWLDIYIGGDQVMFRVV